MNANYETSLTHSIPAPLKNRIDSIIKSLKEAGLNTVSPEDIEDVPLYMNIIEYLGTDAFLYMLCTDNDETGILSDNTTRDANPYDKLLPCLGLSMSEDRKFLKVMGTTEEVNINIPNVLEFGTSDAWFSWINQFVPSPESLSLTHLFSNQSESKLSMAEDVLLLNKALEKFDPEKYEKYKYFVIDESHKGRNCGKGFDLGQPIYRCQECGMDDTCVLCFRCFNPDDHIDHNVMVLSTNEKTSGICDCGDQDAWKRNLNCKADCCSPDYESDPKYNDDYVYFQNQKGYYEYLLGACLDYFIEIFKSDHLLLPYLSIDFSKDFSPKVLEDTATLSIKTDELSKNSHNEYFLVLFNDEYHTFSHVDSILCDLGFSAIESSFTSSSIDTKGFAVICGPDRFEYMYPMAKEFEEQQFTVKILTWNALVQLHLCSGIIAGMKNSLSIKNPIFQKQFRLALAGALTSYSDASTENVCKTVCPTYTCNNSFYDMHQKRDKNVIIADIKIGLPSEVTHDCKCEYKGHESVGHYNPITKTCKQRPPTSRLQTILLFDVKLWKIFRHDAAQLYLSVLATDELYKNIIADQYAEIYASLVDIVAYLDREPQLTLMKECTTQMFSNRSIVDHLSSNDGLSKIIWVAVTIFDDFCAENDGFFLFKKPVIFNASKGFHVAFKQSLYALETILANVGDLEKFLKPDCLFGIFCLLQRFNGAYKLRRKKGEHVLREDQFFITYVEYTMSLYTIIDNVNKLLNDSSFSLQMKESILMFLAHFKDIGSEYIEFTLEDGQTMEILAKLPHLDRVSYMNPLHTFLGTLLTYYPFDEIHTLFQSEDHLMKIADDPMMTLSLYSQASVGLWVRNGLSVVHQLQFYRDQLRSSAYLTDIYLNQLALMFNPPKGIATFFYKWGFLDSSKLEFNSTNDEYDDKNDLMLINMVSMLYLMISERNRFLPASGKQREEELFKASIVYFLLNPPIKYSQFSEFLNDHPLYDTLDNVLNEVAKFQPPKGINCEGTFSLQKRVYDEIDMISVFGSGFGGFTTVESVSKVIGTKKDDGFVIEPKLRKYEDLQAGVLKFSSFADEAIFTKCLEQCLSIASSKLSVDLSLSVLHLIHGIILDNRMFNKDDSFIPESLKTNKIYNNIFKLGFLCDTNKLVKSKAIAVLKLYMSSEGSYITEHLRASFFVDNLEEKLDELIGRRKSVINDQEDSVARKKILIKKRQDALLSKFKKNQEKFLKKQNDEGLVSDNDYDMDHGDEERTIICSSCQETNDDDIFVVPCFFENTPAIRPLNVNCDFGNKWKNSRNDGSNYYIPSASTSSGGDYGFDKAAISCNHPIHFYCLRKYLRQSGQEMFENHLPYFCCPVCQSLSNLVVPIFDNHLPKETDEPVDLFSDKLIPEHSMKLSPDDKKLEMINNNIMHQFFQRSTYYKTELSVEERSTIDSNYSMFALINALANSVSMLEVSSRLSDEPYLDFLNFNERHYKTLKLLGEAIASYRENNAHFGYNYFASNNIANANRAFQYVVDRYFLSEDSLETSLIFAFNQIYEKSIYLVAAKMENAERLNTKCDIDKLFDLKQFGYMRPQMLDTIFLKDNIVKKINGHNTKAYDILFGERTDYFYSSSNKNIKGNKHLTLDERFELLKSMCYTLALGQFKVLLRKTIIFMKMLNQYGSNNAVDIDLINGQWVNDGTDPSLFEDDDEKYCDFLINKISNGKYTSIAKFVFEGKAFCHHERAMVRGFKFKNEKELCRVGDYTKQRNCGLNSCYYAKFYFSFFVGEDTGLIKLLDLKHSLNDYMIKKKETEFNPYTSDHGVVNLLVNSINYNICLECGGEIFNEADVEAVEPDCLPTTGIRRHYTNKCRGLYSTPLRYNTVLINPVTNHVRSVMVYQMMNSLERDITDFGDATSPYLNKYGESTVDTIKANSTPVMLNKERYDILNQKWLNLEILGDEIRHTGSETLNALNHYAYSQIDIKEVNEVELYSLYLESDDLAYTNLNHLIANASTLTSFEIRQLMFYEYLNKEVVIRAKDTFLARLFKDRDYHYLQDLEDNFMTASLAFLLHNRIVYANDTQKYIKKLDSRAYYKSPRETTYETMVRNGDFSRYRPGSKGALNLLILRDYYQCFSEK